MKLWINQHGFTLPEILVVLVLTTIVLTSGMQYGTTMAMQHTKRTALLELQDNLTISAELLEQDISRSTQVLECDSGELNLQQTGRTVHYSTGNDQQAQEHSYLLEGKILYRRESTQYNRQPMANFLDTVVFTYLDRNGNVTTDPQQVRTVAFTLIGTMDGHCIREQRYVMLAGEAYV